MRVTDLLALSHVPRWSIVPRMHEQSVADHTFRVLVIALELVERLKLADAPTIRCLNGMDFFLAILYHDADESRTGDIPTPVKERAGVSDPIASCPWLATSDTYAYLPTSLKVVLSLADKIEALTFISRYGVGPHSVRASDNMIRKVREACPTEWNTVVYKLIGDITNDMGR